jgi:putative hydrolase
VVPANVTSFAESWSLPPDEVRLWVCLREQTIQAVLSRPHVAERLRELLVDVVHGMADDAADVVERLQELDPSRPEDIQRLLDPTAMADIEPSPPRQRAAADLMAVTAALLGYVEHVLDQAANRLLGGRSTIREAWRRRQVGRELSDRAAEAMLGLDLGPAQIDRGAEFVQGVVERAGEEGLVRLWSAAYTLPTPAEVDAPGLWLERTDLGHPTG